LGVGVTESVTKTVNGKLPAVVGVPVILTVFVVVWNPVAVVVPLLRTKPGGSASATLHV
jgi:hypothetical protein